MFSPYKEVMLSVTMLVSCPVGVINFDGMQVVKSQVAPILSESALRIEA